MHRFDTLSDVQQQVMSDLIASRDRFETLFLQALMRGMANGSLACENPSITVKLLLGGLQLSIIWYRPQIWLRRRRRTGPRARWNSGQIRRRKRWSTAGRNASPRSMRGHWVLRGMRILTRCLAIMRTAAKGTNHERYLHHWGRIIRRDRGQIAG